MKNLSTELNELFESVDHTINITKGTYLFQEGMPVKEIYIVRKGIIRISKISADGKELSLGVRSAGDIVNELTPYTNDTIHLLDAKVVENGEVSVLRKDALEKQLKENPKLAFEYMKWMSNHFRSTQTMFRDLMLYGKKGALFSTIIRLTNKYGVEKTNGDILIDFPLTNFELASFCGTSRETISRMLTDLRGEGILSKRNDEIIVHDLNYLRQEIACENCSAEVCTI